MVSAAICLTALIGCLSVSAATRGEGTFTVGDISGKAGASVTVPIELKYTSGGEGMGIAASLFDVSFDTDALTITDIAAGEDATRDPGSGGLPGGEDVPPQDIYTVEYRSMDGETISVVDDAVRILAMPAYNETVPADSETVLTSMTVKLTFRIKDGAAAQDYPITVSKEQTCDYGQATPDEFGGFTYADDEEFIDMTITNGKITVVEDVTEPVLDESLPLGRQVYVGSQFGLYYAIPQSLYSQYDNFYIEVISEHYDESYNITSTTERIYKNEIANTIDGIDYYLYSGTTGYEMLLKIKATVYIEDSTGKVIKYSPTKEDTLVERVKSGVTSEVAKQDKDLKLLKVYLDMVNFATEAEKYFAEQYPDSALASSVNDGKVSNVGFESYQEYASSEPIVAKDINKTFYDENNNPNQSVKLGKQVTIGASNFIAYQINPGDFDTSKITLSVKYTDSYGNNLDKEVSYTDLAETGNWFRYTDIALYDVSKTITAVVSYDGNTLVTNEYSIESAAARNSDPNTTAIFDLIMKFGYSCNDYLSSGFASN